MDCAVFARCAASVVKVSAVIVTVGAGVPSGAGCPAYTHTCCPVVVSVQIAIGPCRVYCHAAIDGIALIRVIAVAAARSFVQFNRLISLLL